MVNNRICSHCGCILRKVRPTIVIINSGIVYPDDPDDTKVWVCPYCQYPNTQLEKPTTLKVGTFCTSFWCSWFLLFSDHLVPVWSPGMCLITGIDT